MPENRKYKILSEHSHFYSYIFNKARTLLDKILFEKGIFSENIKILNRKVLYKDYKFMVLIDVEKYN